jgi:hypothetical protein
MVLRGELVQRYGPGGCIFLTSHTPFNQIADLYPDSARTLAWSSPCEPNFLSLPEPVSTHLNASSFGTLAPCPDATVLKGGCYVLPL